MFLQKFTYFSPNVLAHCAIYLYSTYSLNSTKWLVWQWFSYIKVWSHWTYSSQNVGRKHLFLAQGEERRKKRGALESWSTEGTAISAWKGFEATVWWSTWRRLSRPFHHPLVLLYTRWWHTPHTALWKHTYNSWTKRRNGICNIRIWNYFFIIKKCFFWVPIPKYKKNLFWI